MARKKIRSVSSVSKLPLRASAKPRRRVVPEGKVEMVTTYLQMLHPPKAQRLPHRGERLAIMRAEQPTLNFYRFLYKSVGEQWMWYERAQLDDDALKAIIQDAQVNVDVLYVAGVPAGYVELDGRLPSEVEIAYFGLMPEFFGRGLGHYFLGWAIDQAWRRHPSRVWVHTCNFDHPAAIGVYQRAGFEPYDQQIEIIDDPRLDP